MRFGLVFTAAGMLLASSPHFENYTRLQPMRAFHLVYVVMFLVTGAVAGEYLLKNRAWRWVALFAPLAAGMWVVGWQAFPSSPHLEWPGATPRGEWGSAFRWVRDHTPKDAVFALDPDYLLLPGEDMHGFRAVAERSVLADRVKDSGVVSLFPNWPETGTSRCRRRAVGSASRSPISIGSPPIIRSPGSCAGAPPRPDWIARTGTQGWRFAGSAIEAASRRRTYNDADFPAFWLCVLTVAAQDRPRFFRITPVRPVAELRRRRWPRQSAAEIGDFRQPDLVDVA